MKNKLPDEWQDWIRTSLKDGFDSDDILSKMIELGVDTKLANEAINHLNDNKMIEIYNLKYKEIESKRIISAYFKRGLHKIGLYPEKTLNISNAERYHSSEIELYTIKNFLSADECNKVCDLIKTKLKPSTIVHEGNYGATIRTSKTCDLGLLESPFIDSIDERICSTMNVDHSLSEVMQGQFYELGHEFKPHHDYFEGSEKIVEKHTRTQGQRTYTFMVYLNDVEMGGETCFPYLKKAFSPIKGQALIWNNSRYDGLPNPKTLHQGKPVKLGSKSIITKWFREKIEL